MGRGLLKGKLVLHEGTKLSPEAAASQADAMRAAIQSTEEPASYPAPTTPDEINASDSEDAAYPAESVTPGPPTPIIVSTASYPAASSGDNDVIGRTPIPNVGLRNGDADSERNESLQQTSSPPLLGTLFLWLGFFASLIVFISGGIGAIFYYGRQRDRGN